MQTSKSLSKSRKSSRAHSRQPLLVIPNHHKGAAPRISTRECYVGYFENEHGEQWVLWHNRKSGKTFLTGGEADWQEYAVTADWFEKPASESDGCPIVLEKSEAAWLIACWQAVHAFDEPSVAEKANPS